MSQVFHRSTNTISKISIFGAGFVVLAGLWLLLEFNRTSYATRAFEAREQPVPFSHAHHVGGLGLDCRYCHTAVERSAVAGLPPVKTCMNCHSQVFRDAPLLEPVRESFRGGQALAWTRVHDLPDFAYFNHSAHVNRGVGCSTCHGRIDRMPLVWAEKTLLMEWCLDCHRRPEMYLRPQSEVFNPAYQPPADQLELGRRLVREYGISTRLSCSTCHR